MNQVSEHTPEVCNTKKSSLWNVLENKSILKENNLVEVEHNSPC